MRKALATLTAVAGLGLIGAAPAAAPGLALQSPIGCQVGGPCLIQNYFDHDPGPAWKDQRCGGQTYDGHDGVDFRVPDMAAVARGVPVLAAAAGTVRGGRDGMADISVAKGGRAAIAGKECGNGVVIVHPGGWETQYCHMRKGSVQVKAGQAVAAGQTLGMVGMSGEAEFPHVHLSVRRGTAKIDPFAFGAAPGACNAGTSMWAGAAVAQFTYRSPALLNAGFAAAPVSADSVEAGHIPQPGTASPALVAYGRIIGLKAGDVASLQVAAPDGSAVGQDTTRPMDRDKAQWLMFVGKKRTLAAWPSGRYRARLEVKRGGAVVLERSFDVLL